MRVRASSVVGAAALALSAGLVGAPPAHALVPEGQPIVRLGAAQGDWCPTSAPTGTLRDGSATIGARALCQRAVDAAPTTQAKRAIRAAFTMLGAPYACAGVGRMWSRRYDCSSLVGRAYHQAAGIPLAGSAWAVSTRDLAPWDGRAMSPWLRAVAPRDIRPGDLVVYNTGGVLYRHVVLYLGSGYMLHTNRCDDVARVERFWGFGPTATRSLMGVRRVVTLGPLAPRPVDLSGSAAARATTVSYTALMAGDRDATIRVQAAFNRLLGLGMLVDGVWDGRTKSGFPSFRRHVWGWSTSQASGPPDRATLRALGARTGFTVT